MKTVFLFPGQGAQYPGMAKDLYEQSQAVKDLFEQASQAAGISMTKLLFEGSEDDLKATHNTQIAITLANLSASAVLSEQGRSAELCAGFSVGEYAALAESGVLSAEDAFKAVLIRGEVMEAASRTCDSQQGPSGMSAILGMSYEEAAPIVQALSAEGVFIANHSSPSQIVIAGTARGLEIAESKLNDAGAMKVVRLKVSGPFHSPLLEQAKKDFAARAAALTWKNPTKPIVSNVSAAFISSGEQARDFAAQQIVSTVKWVDSMRLLTQSGASLVLEVGPGRVLGGLWKSFTKEIRCQSAGTLEQIQAIQ